MFVVTLLRRLVVIGSDRKHTVGAEPSRLPCTFNRLRSRIAARSDDHRHAASGLFDHDLRDPVRLLTTERGAFTGGAAWQDHVDAFGYLEINKSAMRILIESTIR